MNKGVWLRLKSEFSQTRPKKIPLWIKNNKSTSTVSHFQRFHEEQNWYKIMPMMDRRKMIHFSLECCVCKSSKATTHQFVISSSRGNDLWKLSCLLLFVVLLVVHLENESWVLSEVVHKTQAYVDLKQCISPHAHHIPANGKKREPPKPNCKLDTGVQWSHISVTLWTRQRCTVISHISQAANEIQVYSDLTHQSHCDLTCQSCCEQGTGVQWSQTPPLDRDTTTGELRSNTIVPQITHTSTNSSRR